MILQVVQLTCGFGEFPASEAARDGSSSQVWLHHAMPWATRCVESELHTRAHTRTRPHAFLQNAQWKQLRQQNRDGPACRLVLLSELSGINSI